jgi:hypothetical protein
MIAELTQDGLFTVMTRMRPEDLRELRATTMTTTARHAGQIWELRDSAWEARTADGEVAGIGGFVPLWSGVCTVWMLATPRFAEVGLEVTRFVRRVILPALQEVGYHRAEARALRGNDGTARWLHLLGFHQEAVIAQFGRAREDFVLFAWTPHEPAQPAH